MLCDGLMLFAARWSEIFLGYVWEQRHTKCRYVLSYCAHVLDVVLPSSSAGGSIKPLKALRSQVHARTHTRTHTHTHTTLGTMRTRCMLTRAVHVTKISC